MGTSCGFHPAQQVNGCSNINTYITTHSSKKYLQQQEGKSKVEPFIYNDSQKYFYISLKIHVNDKVIKTKLYLKFWEFLW